MKKSIYIAGIAIAAIALSSCTATEGTTPGSYKTPVVTIYQYAPAGSRGEGQPPYNPDEDVMLRMVANSSVTEYYYLVELKKDKDSYVAANGMAAYYDRVISTGIKVTEPLDKDTTLTGLEGFYAITAVAIGSNGSKNGYEEIFKGLGWITVAEGTYTFSTPFTRGFVTSATTPATLQVCETNPDLYRFKYLYGTGYSLKLQGMPEFTEEDDDGNTLLYCRIAPQGTPWLYTNAAGTTVNAPVSVRDIGYLQGNIIYVEPGSPYVNIVCIDGPDKGYVNLNPQYYISQGNLGYTPEYFEPNE